MEKKLTNKKKRALKDKNIKLLAEAHNGLAAYYNKRQRYRDAINEYQQLANLYEPLVCSKSNLQLKWAACQRMIGEMYLSMGKFDEALQYVQRHLTVAQEFHNKMEELKAQENLGRIYFLWGQSKCNEDEAKILFLAAERASMEGLKLSASPCLGETAIDELLNTRASILVNIGDVQEHLGNFAAIQNIEKAKKKCSFRRYDDVLHNYYTTEATMHCNKENFDEALGCLDRALELTGKMKISRVSKTCETLAYKADVLCKMANYKDAKKLLKRAWKMNTPDVEDNENIVFCLKVVTAMCRIKDMLESTSLADYETRKKLYDKLGDGACRLKNYAVATEFYKKMLHNAQLAGDSGKEIATIYVSLYETYKNMGRYKDALYYCQMEYELIKDLPEEAFVTLYTISVFQYQAKLYTLVETTCHKAWAAARVTNVKIFEIMALKMMLKVLKRLEETDKIENIKNELRRLGCEDFDNLENTEEELRAVAGCDADTTHVGDDVNLEDLKDEPDTDEEIKVEKSIDTIMRKNVKGETSLHRACIRGQKHKVESLLAGGHPVNETDNCNWSPIHEACSRGHRDIVDLLINANADVDALGGEDRDITPLYDAALNGHLLVVTLLLDKGANPTLKTKDGKTPLFALQQWRSKFIGTMDKNQEAYYIRVCDRLKRSFESTQSAYCSSLKSQETPHKRTVRDAAETLPSTSKINSPLSYDSLPSTSKVNSSIRDEQLPYTPKENSPIRDDSLPSELTINGHVSDESAPTSTAKISDSIRDMVLPSNSDISVFFNDSKPQQDITVTYSDDSDVDLIICEDTPPVSSGGRPNTNIGKYRDALLDSIGFVKIEKFDDDDINTTKKRTKKRKRNDGLTDFATNTHLEIQNNNTNNNNNDTQPLSVSNKNGKQKKTRKRKSAAGFNVNENSSGKSDEYLSSGRNGEDTMANTSTSLNDTLHENTVRTNIAYDKSIENMNRQIYYSFHEKIDVIDSSKTKPKPKTKKAKKSRPATLIINGSSEELIFDDSLDSDEFPAVNVKYTKPCVSTKMADDSDVNKQDDNKNRKVREPSPCAAIKPSLLIRRSSTENKNEIKYFGECNKAPTQVESQNDEDMSEPRIVSHYFENDESMYVTAVESQADVSNDDISRNDNEVDSPNPEGEFDEVQSTNNMQPVDEIEPSNRANLPIATPASLIVHFEDKALHITLNEDTIRKSTISWLIEELKSRLNGASPVFRLMTGDGVALSEDDPLSLVLSSPELKACINNASLAEEPYLESYEALELHNSITDVISPHDEPASPLSTCDTSRNRTPSPPCLHDEETLLLPHPDLIQTLTPPRFDRDETNHIEQDEIPVSTSLEQDELPTFTIKYDGRSQSTTLHPKREASLQEESPSMNLLIPMESSKRHASSRSKHESSRSKHDKSSHSKHDHSSHSTHDKSHSRHDNSSRHRHNKSSHHRHDKTSDSRQISRKSSSSQSHARDESPKHVTLAKIEESQRDESPNISSHRPNNDEPAQTTLLSEDESFKLSSSRKQNKPSRSRHDSLRKSANLYTSRKHDKSSRSSHDKTPHSRHDKSRMSTESRDKNSDGLPNSSSRHPKDEGTSQYTLALSKHENTSISTHNESPQHASTHPSHNESPQLSPHESSQNAVPGSMHDESHQNISQHKQTIPKSTLSIILKRQDNKSWQAVAATSPRPKAFRHHKDKSKHSLRSKHDKSPQLISSRSRHNKVQKLSSSQRLKHRKLQRLEYYASRQPSSSRFGHESSSRQLENTESLSSTPLEHDLEDSQSHTSPQLEDCVSPLSSHIENNALSPSPLHEDRVSPTQPYPEDGSPTRLNLEGALSPPQPQIEELVLPSAPSLEDHVLPSVPYLRYCKSTQSTRADPQPSQPKLRSNELPSHAFLAFPTSSEYCNPAPGVVSGPSLPPEPQAPTNCAAPIKIECPDEPDLDDDVLQLLGDRPNESSLGPSIHSRVAVKWNKILASGLKKEDNDKIMNEYLVPYNCQLLEAPPLNPEVKAVVRETFVGLDSKIMNQQKRLGTAISALGMAVKSIISNENLKKTVLKSIFDACDLLCDMHREETEIRRDYIMSAISSDLKESLVNTVRGKQLFGDNVKSIKSDPRFDSNLFNVTDEPSTGAGNVNLKQEIEDDQNNE